MTKIVAVALIALAAIIAIPTITTLIESNKLTSEATHGSVQEPSIPKVPDKLAMPAIEKVVSVKRSVKLEAGNTVVLRGVVDASSVGKVMKEIGKMSRRLSPSETIYLVLDTPGGSVLDGADLIDYLEAIPQKVTTVTLFAASMGFQIVENNPGERLIVRNGILMSHRAAIDGLGGQMDGELESRYRMYKRQVDYLETVDAKRMDLTLDQYKAKIKDELWVHGFDAKAEKVADDEVLLTCGNSMKGIDTVVVDTFFGAVDVDFDKCPLIKQPLAIHLEKVQANAKSYVSSIIYDLFLNKEKFTKDIILTDKYYKIFP